MQATATEDVWVVLEADGRKISPHAIALMNEGRNLARADGCRLNVVYIGGPVEDLDAQAAGYGASRFLTCAHADLARYHPTRYANALLAMLGAHHPRLLLMLASSTGGDLAPRIALRLGAACVTNCVDVEVSPGSEPVFLKPVQRGRLHARIRGVDAAGTVVTMLPRSLVLADAPPEPGSAPERIAVDAPGLDAADPIQPVGFEKADPRTIDISEAETIVAFGRGIGDVANVPLVEAFAERVNGALAGTRPTVDMGILPHARQIGQTGKRVSPKLLFLLGISGATEFVMGIEHAGTSVAINIDRQSPIFKSADLAIVGDLMEIAPKILDHLGEASKPTDP